MAKKGQLQPMALSDLTNIILYVLKLDPQAFWIAKDGNKGSPKPVLLNHDSSSTVLAVSASKLLEKRKIQMRTQPNRIS